LFVSNLAFEPGMHCHSLFVLSEYMIGLVLSVLRAAKIGNPAQSANYLADFCVFRAKPVSLRPEMNL
ncbi:MAG TPA: hypothetical protein H9814_05615, partial [Candidatus Bacteroides merdigallinarum]|nr:hypothetical protein [Candidatus Bacteroides merdigallinarum]